jgi:hypothetical protein
MEFSMELVRLIFGQEKFEEVAKGLCTAGF